jgi:hypothetical protein
MTLRIARPVFAQPVWLIGGRLVDLGAGRLGVGEMGIDVRNKQDNPCAGHVNGLGGCEFVFFCDTMKPNARVTGTNLAMHDLAIGRPVHASRFEAECLNQ